MSSIRRLVNDVVEGRRPLDITTAREVIDSATGDRRIEDSDELAPLRDLFVGDDVRPGISATRGGSAFLLGFLRHAEDQHADIGDARSSHTKGLKPLAARFAADKLLSREALRDRIAEYRGTQPGETYTRPAGPGTTRQVTVTPEWVERVREVLIGHVTLYMAGSRLERLWHGMGVSSEVDWRADYNEPGKTFEGYLAKRSAKRAPDNAPPLHDQVRAFERKKVKDALASVNGDKDRAAAALGISVPALERKMSEHGL